MNPTSQNVAKLIQTFNRIPLKVRNSKRKLDMGLGGVRDCGSPHCHAGWFCVAIGFGYFFRDGIEIMEQTLGIDSIKNWAHDNPSIWGNEYGYDIFSNALAFASNEKPYGAECLQDIIDHWKGVYERLVVLEHRPSRQNISSELALKPQVEERLDEVEMIIHS